MKNTHPLQNGRTSALLGLLISALFTITAILYEPRLLPLALFSGPVLIGLAFPPAGRRVYRDLGIALLLATGTAAIMLFSARST